MPELTYRVPVTLVLVLSAATERVACDKSEGATDGIASWYNCDANTAGLDETFSLVKDSPGLVVARPEINFLYSTSCKFAIMRIYIRKHKYTFDKKRMQHKNGYNNECIIITTR